MKLLRSTTSITYETIAFCVLLLIHLIPLFTGKFFPTSDGAAHLYNAELMKDMLLGTSPIHVEFLEWNIYPDPNRFSHVFLTTLLLVFPDYIAEKILLATYVILFAVSFRYLIRNINYKATFLSVFAFPLVYNLSFWYGFYNFCFSLIFFFLFVGYWLRTQYNYTLKRTIVLIFLTLCMYFSHPVSYVFSILFLGLWIVMDAFRRNKPVDYTHTGYWKRVFLLQIPKPDWTFLFRQTGMSVLIYGVTGILLLVYVLRIGASAYYYPSSKLTQVFQLTQLMPLQFLAQDETLLLGILYHVLFCLLIVCVIRYHRMSILHYVVLFGLLAGLALYYIFGPDGAAGGSGMHPRIGLFFYIYVVIFAAFYAWKLSTQRIVYMLVALISIGLMIVRTKELLRLQSVFDEIMTAQEHIPAHAVTLPYCFYPIDSTLERNFPIDYYPLKHYSNYLLLGKKGISLDNYEARTGYFPLNWNLDKISDPVQLNHLNDVMYEKEHVRSIEFHEEMIGQPVDYVTLVGVHATDKSLHKDVMTELEEEFDLIYESDNRIVHVYKKKTLDKPIGSLISAPGKERPLAKRNEATLD
ncbi:hypothetical protein QNI19_12555 [Cytophagaceae bacterium DM2B3-1]|uniref:Glycosyltransferase RgtA/B/C/D-like domain-containing protein n=1 Tax=Xanthocytophaga flava TaxID=3048013 RepID=A0ABT7CM82_9BACT|nr:hypothetical protein [Xanthocytophaga flavus]MDJ1467684.1 hypothetical protein [Xanthocytophaga flavus]MDJ1493764.1 hypothetical protein [Xanthocytophaga flavus]